MSISLSVEVTNACHLRCATCLPESGSARDGELTGARLAEALGLLAERGAVTVLFTGGEPFLRPDFVDVLYAAHAAGLGTAVITSGTLWTDRTERAVADCGTRLSISFDGVTEATNDAIRGRGTYRRATATARRLAAAGLPFDLSFTVTRPSAAELPMLREFADDLGCGRLYLSEVSRAGRAARNWATLSLLPEQRAGLTEAAARIAREMDGGELVPDDRCWVDGHSLYIDSTGRAYACSEVFQRRPSAALGSVADAAGVDRVLDRLAMDHSGKPCCYETFASERVFLARHTTRPCVLVDAVLPVPVGVGTGLAKEVTQ